MSSKEEQARRSFGPRAAFYTTSTVHNDPAVLARVVELAAPEPSWRALDVGTGTGHTAFAVAPHVALVVASDLTHEMLLEARQLEDRLRHGNVLLCQNDVHTLPFDDATFDLVTCRRAAHHFSRIDDALAEMARVLVPGGRLVIDDRSVPEDDAADACMNELDRLHDDSHVRNYRPSEWRSMLGKHLHVDEMETYELHRPLSALTQGVDPERVARIAAIVTEMSDEQRTVFAVREIDGEIHHNHWFVMVSGRKRSAAEAHRAD